MKLSTILTARGYTLRERASRLRELALRTAAHRLPRTLAYWSLIDSGARHVRSNEVVPDVPFLLVLQRAGDELGAA